jgi:hypothetical protein
MTGAHSDDGDSRAGAPPPKGKTALARVLIEELDTSVDANAEQLWIAEAQRRYNAYLNGELEALPGDEVMARAQNALTFLGCSR